MRRFRRSMAVLIVAALGVAGWSYVTGVQGQTGSLSARSAEWVRDHGGAGIVAWVENLWYSHHPPPVGGRPKAGAIPAVTPRAAATPVAAAGLPRPAPIPPVALPALPGEGVWHPAGRTVDGVPAVYEAYLRPDAVHTSLVAGVAWMDTTLLRASLYSGSYIPGGRWGLTAPVAPSVRGRLVVAFNSGFRLRDAQGGYLSEGRTVAPLRDGMASAVIYRDGTMTVGQWGRDVRMGPDVVAVRQNLHLLVDGGQVVPGLLSRSWGATLGNRVYVWRSGLGVTRTGALVYVAGPGLNVSSLANLLVRAGAVRAMELDINTDWVNLATYAPPTARGQATTSDGRTLLPTMAGGSGRYFVPSWNRDFFALTAVDNGASVPLGAGPS